MNEILTDEQRIARLEQRIRSAIQSGDESVDVKCPWCHEMNQPGATLCCIMMGKAANAIMQRIETRARVDVANRIADSIRN